MSEGRGGVLDADGGDVKRPSGLSHEATIDISVSHGVGSEGGQVENHGAGGDGDGGSEVPHLGELHHPSAPLGTVIMICLAALFVFADQNVMAPNLTPIAREFGMSNDDRDTKLGGHVSAAFFLFGAPVSLIVGYFADNLHRPLVFAIVVILGEIPCFATAFVTNYTELFWCRALTGIAVGGIVPLTYSLLGDLYPARLRSLAAALVGVCIGGGILVGQMIGGLVGTHDSWRTPFIIVSVPAIIMAIAIFFFVDDPKRGQQEDAAIASGETYAGRFTWDKAIDMLLVRTNLLIFLTAAASTIPWGAISVFANDYLSQDQGLGSEKSTFVVVMFGVGAAAGILGGGYLGQLIYNNRRRNITVYMTLTTFAGIIPMAFLFAFARPSLFGLCLFLGFLAGVLLSAASANAKAMILNVNLPEVRGSAFAVLNVMDDLGKGIGPIVFAAMARSIGRAWAMHTSILIFLITALLTLFTYWTLEEDEDKVQSIISQQQDRASTSRRNSIDSTADNRDGEGEHQKRDQGKGGDGNDNDAISSSDEDVDHTSSELLEGDRRRGKHGAISSSDQL